ncbi:hypothetical protein, partial [Pseudomonas aeruginosa]|uniref:hypothetical protein n=1 Tax=Pseudomonas aeruginosa TaxID=287 RepID=UPI001C3E8CEF
ISDFILESVSAGTILGIFVFYGNLYGMITQHITFYCFKTLLYVAFRERAERTILYIITS